MAVTVKQISVLQSNGSYLTKDIGVDAQNVDIDETHTLVDKIIDWDSKVDKDGNKVLSTNDYTTEEKNKLAGLSNYNDSALSERVTNIENVIPSTVSAENKLATMADIPAGGGTGAEGTTDYSELSNKPQIAGITLSGNKTLSDLGIQPAEENKGLSTNDYTTEDKEKLAGLSNYDDSGLSSRVTNLEDVIPETATSSNKLATLADIPSGTGTGGGTTNYPNLTNKPKIAGVELVGDKSLADLGIQPAETGKGLSSNDFTNAEKTKLEGIETGAKANVIESISVNGATQEIVDKNVEITIPQTSTSVPNGGTTGQALVKKSDTDGDVEWKNISGGDSSFTFNNSDFKVSAQGEVSLDPSQRIVSITKEEYEALSEEEQKNGTNYFITNGTDDELNNKVDKIEGKGLSTNDYTTEEKNKLAGLSNYDDTALDNRIDNIEELIPTTASEDNKLATMADIPTPFTSGGGTTNYNDLENKPSIAGVALSGNKTLADLGIQPAEQGKGLSTENYTTEEKTKLSSLSNYDDTALAGRITNIEDIIPSTASENNKLATIADISSGSGDAVDYNSLSALIAIDNYSEIEVGEIYTLGNGAKTNQNNSIQVKCLSIDNETAIMQTYGVTAGPWPGEGDLTETYNSYFGELSSAISEVKLPTGTNANDIEPSGAYDILKTAAINHSSFGTDASYARLSTLTDYDRFANVVLSNGDVSYSDKNYPMVCAPYFKLNLAKVLVNDGVIELDPAYQDANASSVVSKIEQKLNNRYTKDEVNSLLGDISSIPEGGTTGQVLAKKSDTDGDVEWTNASNGSSNTFNTSDFDITEQGEVSLKPSQRAWIGTRAEWDALSIEEKEKYGGIINITDDPNELDNKVDKVEGKGLSTNDYTDEEKTKLAGLSNYDDTLLSGRVTTIENTLDNKVNKIEGKGLSTEDYTTEEKTKLAGLTNYDDASLSGRVTTVENTLSDKVDKDGDKVLSTNDYTDAEKTKLAGLSNYDDTEIDNRVQGLENIIPESVSSENRLATMEDISGGSEVSVEQKVSEGVNIASITIDGHTTEIFAPEGSGSSTITIVNPNLYDTSAAVKGSGNDYNIYCEVSVSPNTDYVFDIQNSPYSWAGVRVGNTTIGNNAPDRKLVEFNSGTNTSVRLQFYPGNDTTVAQTDFSNILFYEAGKIPGETTTIENPNSGSGSNLINTDITEILLTASSQHPIEIVLIGDSITEGYSATGMSSAGSSHPVPTWANYPSWAGLLNSYITANFPNVTVTNRGYSGQVSSYGASNINSWITNNRQIAIVMFGTNNRTTQANMDSLANDYTTMLNRCKSVGAKMIPMCCIPATPYNQSISGKYVGTMEQVHNILVNWAKTNGYELLDLYSLMMAYINNNTSNLESMGLIYVGSEDNNLHLHPNDAGHAVMFDFIKHKLGIGTAGNSGGGSAKYRHRVAMYCLNSGTTYVVVNLCNNRSTPYNAATTTTTDEINAFKADVLAGGYTSALQKGTLMCSGVIKGTHVYGMYMGTSSSGLSAVADKLNFIDGTNFNITLPLETGGTSSASTSLRLWDTVEPA